MNKLVALISGSGSNLQAIIDAIASGELQATIELVVSNRSDAYGLERARLAGIPTLYFPLGRFKDGGRTREDYDRALAAELRPYRPGLVVLAGWMLVLSPAFLDLFPEKVINLHPALPGMFAGTHAIERTFAAFQNGEVEHGGCMIHYVVPEIDAGPIIIAEKVPLFPGENLAQFEERIHATEHRIIVEAIRLHFNEIEEDGENE